MKKIFIMFFAAMSLSLFAQTPTTDHFTVSDVTLVPGGSPSVMQLLLEGTQIYTAYNLDIQLPEGISVPSDRYGLLVNIEPDDGDADPIYPTDRRGRPLHDAVSNMIANNTLRIACTSDANDDFEETSGVLLYITLQASPYAKAGLNDIHISGCNLTTSAAVKYVPANVSYSNITISGQSSVTLNISATNQWSTCVLPFAHTPEGFTAYSTNGQFTDKGLTYVQLVEASTMQAYTPYIVYAENGYSNTLNGTVDPATYPDGQNGVVVDDLLKGTILPYNITSGYVLQNQGDGAMFYNVNGNPFSIPAGKCWLELPASSAQRIMLTTDEEMAIRNHSVAEKASGVYTLSGVPVAEPVPGNIYVKDGQRVLILK